MPKYQPEDYSLPYALQNIGYSFWKNYQNDLLTLAKNRQRTDIIEKIHSEWNATTNCIPTGTNIRIEWAMAIFDYGDWEKSLSAPVPSYKKGNTYSSCIDPRKKYPAEYRCDNGIYVRSLSELCIANWFYANSIGFEYERAVFFPKSKEQAHSDFYLPDYHVHIEFWGMTNDAGYEKYKLWKEANYVANGIPFLSFYHSDLKNFRERFEAELRRLG